MCTTFILVKRKEKEQPQKKKEQPQEEKNRKRTEKKETGAPAWLILPCVLCTGASANQNAAAAADVVDLTTSLMRVHCP